MHSWSHCSVKRERVDTLPLGNLQPSTQYTKDSAYAALETGLEVLVFSSLSIARKGCTEDQDGFEA